LPVVRDKRNHCPAYRRGTPFCLALLAAEFIYSRKSACSPGYFLLDDRGNSTDRLGFVDAKAFFQHHCGSAGLSHKRPLPLRQASNLFRRNSHGSGRHCLALFTAEFIDHYFVCCCPAAEGKMGGRQACAGIPRIWHLRGQNDLVFSLQQTIAPGAYHFPHLLYFSFDTKSYL
jgi:hypothetical protein